MCVNKIIIIYVHYECQRSTKMDAMLAFLLLFYWRSFTARRAIMLRNRRRLFEAQRRVEFARRQLRRRRILMTLVIAAHGSYYPIERRFWVSPSR